MKLFTKLDILFSHSNNFAVLITNPNFCILAFCAFKTVAVMLNECRNIHNITATILTIFILWKNWQFQGGVREKFIHP